MGWVFAAKTLAVSAYRMRQKHTLLLLACLAPPVCASEPAVNQPVGHFRIATLSGHNITPDSHPGRILVVNLWATWCVPCLKEMPEIEMFYKKYRARGVDVVGVSLDDRSELAAVRQMMSAYSFPAALAVDSDLGSFGTLRHVPATFVIDRQGVLKRNGWLQPASIDFAALESLLLPLLASQPKPRTGD